MTSLRTDPDAHAHSSAALSWALRGDTAQMRTSLRSLSTRQLLELQAAIVVVATGVADVADEQEKANVEGIPS